MRKKRFTSSWLASASALALIFGTTATGAHAQTSTYTVSNQTVSQVNLSSPALSNGLLSTPTSLSAGSYTYNYVAVYFTPTTNVTNATFGIYEANFDTVAVLYSGSYDPLHPGTNAMVGNDDGNNLYVSAGLTSTTCTGLCSDFTTNLVGGQNYYLFLSTYSPGTPFTLPVSFFATGTTFSWGTVPSTATPTSTDIDTAAAGGYNASLLGSSLNAAFAGGTLYFTTNNQQFSQNFTLGNSATNTINISGLTTVFSGNFSDRSTNGSLIFTNTGTSGRVTLSGANSYTGSTTIDNNANVELTGTISNTSGVVINSGGSLTISNGGALTSHGVSNNANGHLVIAQGGTLTDDMDNAGTVDNSGTSNAIVNTNTGTLTNLATGVWNGAVASNTGTLTNAGTWNGNIATSGTFANTGLLNGTLTNSGTANFEGGSISGAIVNQSGGKICQTNTVTPASTFNNQSGAYLYVSGNYGVTGVLNNSGTVTIQTGGAFTNTPGTTNNGYIMVANGGTWNGNVTNTSLNSIRNDGIWVGKATNNASGTLTNNGAWTGTINNIGVFSNNGGTVSGLVSNSGSATITGTLNGGLVNTSNGAVGNFGTINGGVTNSATTTYGVAFANFGTINGGLTNSGSFGGNGSINGGVVNTGAFNSSGTVNGGLQNSATVYVSGAVNGTVVNSTGGTFLVGNTLTSDATSSFTNQSGATLTIMNGGYTLAGALANAGVTEVRSGQSLTAESISNAGTINNAGTLNAIVNTSTGTLTNAGTWNGNITTSGTFANSGTLNGNLASSGTINASGALTGDISNSGIFTLTGDLSASGNLTNSGAGVLWVNGGNLTSLTSLTNSSTANVGVQVDAGRTLSFTSGSAGSVVLTNASGASLVNNGTISLANGLRLANSGTLQIGTTGNLLTPGGITNTSSGLITVLTGGSVTDDLDNAGTVNNAGTFNAVVNSNTGTLNNLATGVWNGAVASSTGTLTNAGTWNGNITTSGTFANTGTLNGALTVTGGQAVTTGTVTGGLTNTANLWAQGALNGAVVNSGNVTLTGTLSNDGSAFSNSGNLIIGGNTYSGIGAFTNASGGTAYIGTSTTNGHLSLASLSNSGTVNLMNGRTGDTVVVSGAYTGAAGSVLSFDIDLAKGTSDKLIVGTLNGQSTVRLNNTAATKHYLASPLVLVSSTGGTGTLTTGTDAGTSQALSSDSLMTYSFRKLQNSNDWGIVSALNGSALGNLAATLTTFTTAQSLSLAKLPEEVFAYEDTYGVNQWMASSWAEAYSGDMTSSSDVSLSDAYSSATKTKVYSSQNGVQYGFGAGIYNINGTGMNLHAGFMGGSTDAKSQDKAMTGSNTRLDVPHYGYYAALTHQGVRLTVQDRFDVLRMNLTNPALSLMSNQLKGSSETLSIGVSKHYTIKDVFIEPAINYTNTKINVHTLILADNMGSVQLSEIKSHLLRVGARFGTTLTTKSVTWKPYGELSALNETAPDTQTAYLPEGGMDPIWVTGKHGGSFAQVTAGVEAQSRSNPNLSGYVSADVRQGHDIGGWGLRTGVSYRFQ